MSLISDNSLYSYDDPKIYAKYYLNSEISETHNTNNPIKLQGEEDIEVQKVFYGGIVMTTRRIGELHCNLFNKTQQINIKSGKFAHKTLCQNENLATGLVFLTLKDLISPYYYDMLEEHSLKDILHEYNNRELCQFIEDNVKNIILRDFTWILEFSKTVLKDYYNLPEHLLKIKLNFIMDDRTYGQRNNGRLKGGLLLTGLLDIMLYYDYLKDNIGDDIGMICQILSPTGHPSKKKWIQIDVGISFVGKRLHKKNTLQCLYRTALRSIKMLFIKDVFYESVENVLYYGVLLSKLGYEGYEIFIFEIFYPDLIIFNHKDVNDETDFCKCEERKEAIENYKKYYKTS